MILEEIIIGYLGQNQLAPVAAEKIPGENTYIVVQKTGGNRENHIDHGNVAIQCYAPSKLATARLADSINNLMLDYLPELDSISRVYLNSGPYDFTDADTKEYRYQAYYNITFYGGV